MASRGLIISFRRKSATFSFCFGVWWVDTEVWLSQVGQVLWFYSLVKALFLLSFALEKSSSPLKTGHTEDLSQRNDTTHLTVLEKWVSLCSHSKSMHSHRSSKSQPDPSLLPQVLYFKCINNLQATLFPDHAEKSWHKGYVINTLPPKDLAQRYIRQDD